jgi:hypothetical protein
MRCDGRHFTTGEFGALGKSTKYVSMFLRSFIRVKNNIQKMFL